MCLLCSTTKWFVIHILSKLHMQPAEEGAKTGRWRHNSAAFSPFSPVQWSAENCTGVAGNAAWENQALRLGRKGACKFWTENVQSLIRVQRPQIKSKRFSFAATHIKVSMHGISWRALGAIWERWTNSTVSCRDRTHDRATLIASVRAALLA